MNAQTYPIAVGGFNAEVLKRAIRWTLVSALCVAAAALGSRLMAPVALDFPDFPVGVAAIDLGQSLTIKVDALNDGGQGVAWSCEGDACGKVVSTTKWATFYATGITGTAVITATSIRRPSVHKSLKLTVYLNAVPDMLCNAPRLSPEMSPESRIFVPGPLTES